MDARKRSGAAIRGRTHHTSIPIENGIDAAFRPGHPPDGVSVVDVRREAEPIADDGAANILASAARDEDDAAAARLRYRTHGLQALEPDAAIRSYLGRDERLVAVRRDVALDRRTPTRDAAGSALEGDLYLTTRRLLHLGGDTIEFELDDVQDAMLVGESLFLLMRDGVGLVLDADRPRLLRVQISAARSSRRSAR